MIEMYDIQLFTKDGVKQFLQAKPAGFHWMPGDFLPPLEVVLDVEVDTTQEYVMVDGVKIKVSDITGDADGDSR